ncbi:MAG: ATP-binding protein [Flexilinea sp.]|nr:ATP-binding protein [Flexilinea sp.]
MDPIKSIAERIARDFVPPENPVTPSVEPENRFGLGDPDCPICHGTGFVIRGGNEEPGSGTMTPCECRVRMFEFDRKKVNANVSNMQGYEKMTFDSFIIPSEESNEFWPEERLKLEEALYEAKHFAANPKKWLFYTGIYGTGKTHLAAAIANYALENGYRIIFQPVPDLLDELRSSYNNKNDSYEETIERIKSIPLLILDDLGAQNTTDWAEEKLYQIFNYRYVNKLPTVITSNVGLSKIDGRIVSRLGDRDLTTVIHMNVPSYRTKQRINDYEDNISILHLLSDKTFDNFDPRRNLTGEASRQLNTAVDRCKEFARETKNWLVLIGPSGIGKMHLAAAVGNKCKKDGDQLFFVTASDLLDYLRATYSPNSTITYDAVFDKIRKCEVLILNYLDTMNATSWAKEKIYQLLNYRYQAKLPTMITLQKPLKVVDQNIRSRLADTSICTVVNMFSVPMYYSAPDEDIENMKNDRGKNKLVK